MTLTSARHPLAEAGPLLTASRQPSADEHRLRHAFERYFALVWRSLRRFGVPAASADDIAQQVFLTFSERLRDVEAGRERAYLLSVAVRSAANERRRLRRVRETPAEGADLDVVSDARTPEQLLLHKQRRQRLDLALATLPLDQRVIFVLFELEGLTLPEIADSLGIPLGTATSRLRRARGRFEAWIGRQNEGNER
jgi:RNA polymerase sigma-70 factor (ECF subfamily)